MLLFLLFYHVYSIGLPYNKTLVFADTVSRFFSSKGSLNVFVADGTNRSASYAALLNARSRKAYVAYDTIQLNITRFNWLLWIETANITSERYANISSRFLNYTHGAIVYFESTVQLPAFSTQIGRFSRCSIAESQMPINSSAIVMTTLPLCNVLRPPSPAPTPIARLPLHRPVIAQNGTCSNGPNLPCQPLIGSMVFTTLFTKHVDGTGPRKIDPYLYIGSWYSSIHLVGMHGLVIYDVLPDEFIASHSTHAIIFRKTESYFNRTPNDRRFYVYRDILRAEKHLSVCVFSDGRDVRFQRNVFDYIIEETLRDTTKSALFVGLDVRTVGQHDWLKRCDKGEFANSSHINSSLLNAGFLGCTRIGCLAFLDRLVTYLDRFQRNGNCNMLSFNRAVYDLVDANAVRIVTGQPLINRLFDSKRDDTIYVMHKGYQPKP